MENSLVSVVLNAEKAPDDFLFLFLFFFLTDFILQSMGFQWLLVKSHDYGYHLIHVCLLTQRTMCYFRTKLRIEASASGFHLET